MPEVEVSYDSFFDFYGVPSVVDVSTPQKKQKKGDCILCGEEKHFFYNPTNGLFDCKKCSASGNNYSFITQLHKYHLENTPDEKYQELAASRYGINDYILKEAGFAWDPDGNRWLVPYYGSGPCLTNLGAFRPNVGYRIFKGPGMALGLYRPFYRDHFTDNIIITEGEWDQLALHPLLKQASEEWSITSVPGSNVFKPEFVDEFRGKNVYLLYDKDDPGKKGIMKAGKMLTGSAASVNYMAFPDELHFQDCGNPKKPGKDIRDLIVHLDKENLTKKRRRRLHEIVVPTIVENMVEYKQEEKSSGYISTRFSLPEIDNVTNWDDNIGVFKKWLYLTPGNIYAIATCFAVTISPFFPGEPLWLFLVGPPSCGKTTVVESFGTSNMYCDAQSQITAKMLVNGYKVGDGVDISYLPTLHMRTLIIKDYTTVLSLSSHEQDELYGILRDAFDGSFRKRYGNNEERYYDKLKFGMIAGVTKAIHGDCRSSLGERFLKIDYLERDEFDEMHHIKAALDGMEKKEERSKALSRTTLGFLDHLLNNLPDQLPVITSQFEMKMSALAMVVARLRAQVVRRNDESLLYRPDIEIGSRLAVQFKKMAQCLMVVYGKTESDNELYKTIRKLALDSCIPFNAEFARRMYDFPNGISRNDIAYHMQIPPTNVHRTVVDLQQLGLIRSSKVESVGRGRPKELYTLDDSVWNLWKMAMDTDLVGNSLATPNKEIAPTPAPRRRKLL